MPGMRRRGESIVDGAFVANVPAEVVRARGADFVLSANVVGPTAALLDDEGSEGKVLRRLGSRLALALTRNWRLVALWDVGPGRIWHWYRAYVLAQWQVGQNQGRLAASVRLDMFSDGVQMWEGWRMAEVRDQLAERLEVTQTARRVLALYEERELWGESYYAKLGYGDADQPLPDDPAGRSIAAHNAGRRDR